MNPHRIAKLVSGFMICGVLALGPAGAQADNNAADLAFELAKQLNIPAQNAPEALRTLQGRGIIPVEVFSGDPVTPNLARAISEGMTSAGLTKEDTDRILASSAAAANIPEASVRGTVLAARPAETGQTPPPPPPGPIVAQAAGAKLSAATVKNVGDLSLALAKKMGIDAADGQSAWKALQGKKWIPEEIFFTDPVTSNVAQAIGIGMIKAGIKPRETARSLASAAAAASIPLQEAVQGIVAAAVAAGVDVAEAAKAASAGAVQGSAARVAGLTTMGKYIGHYFVNKGTRSSGAGAYLPKGKADFAGVIAQLAAKGEKSLAGAKASDPLTRQHFLTLSYLLAGGKAGASLGTKKLFLKQKGLVSPSDIGFIKSFQGDATITHASEKKAIKVTGNEAIQFKDIGETELDAKIELQFDDGSILTISEDTALTIDEMVYDPKTNFRSIKLRVTSGTIHVQTAKNDNPKSRFSIVTPTVVAGLRGTDVYMSVTPAGVSNMISNTGANAGNVVMRGVTLSDNPPAPVAPPPGPPPVLPATPAQAPPAITITPGNASSAAVGQAAPAPPAPPTAAAVAAATAATAITNPTTPQPASPAGAAAGAAAAAAASGAVQAAQAAGADPGAVAPRPLALIRASSPPPPRTARFRAGSPPARTWPPSPARPHRAPWREPRPRGSTWPPSPRQRVAAPSSLPRPPGSAWPLSRPHPRRAQSPPLRPRASASSPSPPLPRRARSRPRQ